MTELVAREQGRVLERAAAENTVVADPDVEVVVSNDRGGNDDLGVILARWQSISEAKAGQSLQVNGARLVDV